MPGLKVTGPITIDDMVERIRNATDSTASRLNMLATFTSMDKVAESIKLRAVMADNGYGKLTASDELAYAFVKIARPDLLEDPDGD